jgi:hypothetical protein
MPTSARQASSQHTWVASKRVGQGSAQQLAAYLVLDAGLLLAGVAAPALQPGLAAHLSWMRALPLSVMQSSAAVAPWQSLQCNVRQQTPKANCSVVCTASEQCADTVAVLTVATTVCGEAYVQCSTVHACTSAMLLACSCSHLKCVPAPRSSSSSITPSWFCRNIQAWQCQVIPSAPGTCTGDIAHC